MVATKKGYIEFCLNSCPSLKQLDLKKVTPEMREQNGNGFVVEVKSPIVHQSDSTAIDTDSYLGKLTIGQTSQISGTPITSSVNVTHTSAHQTVQNTNAANNEDISPEGLLQVIA